jgi:hypothetical protein
VANRFPIPPDVIDGVAHLKHGCEQAVADTGILFHFSTDGIGKVVVGKSNQRQPACTDVDPADAAAQA